MRVFFIDYLVFLLFKFLTHQFELNIANNNIVSKHWHGYLSLIFVKENANFNSGRTNFNLTLMLASHCDIH